MFWTILECYTLTPVAERRNDFDEKVTAFSWLVTQHRTRLHYFVPNKDRTIMSVHELLNNIISDPTADYFSGLELLKIDVACEFRNPTDIQFLVVTRPIDDEYRLVYIVAYHRLVASSAMMSVRTCHVLRVMARCSNRLMHLLERVLWMPSRTRRRTRDTAGRWYLTPRTAITTF